MHRCRITHTDLKPENLMLVSGASDVEPRSGLRLLRDTRLMLIDFGSATFESGHHTRVVTTRHYRAPEVVLDMGWGPPIDLWSLGCILAELMTGAALFQTHDDLEHLALMVRILGPFDPRFILRAPLGRTFYSASAGRLRWPENAPSSQSVAYVRDSARPLAVRRSAFLSVFGVSWC
jgi:serine/threonine protein kinase